MERFRLPVSAGFNTGHPHGGHYDRFAHLTHAAASSARLSNRENFKTD